MVDGGILIMVFICLFSGLNPLRVSKAKLQPMRWQSQHLVQGTMEDRSSFGNPAIKSRWMWILSIVSTETAYSICFKLVFLLISFNVLVWQIVFRFRTETCQQEPEKECSAFLRLLNLLLSQSGNWSFHPVLWGNEIFPCPARLQLKVRSTNFTCLTPECTKR